MDGRTKPLIELLFATKNTLMNAETARDDDDDEKLMMMMMSDDDDDDDDDDFCFLVNQDSWVGSWRRH